MTDLFSRGGFSSSRLDDAEISIDVDVMNLTLCRSDPIQNEMIASQDNIKKRHQENKVRFFNMSSKVPHQKYQKDATQKTQKV